MRYLIATVVAFLFVVSSSAQSNFKEKTVFKNDDVEIRQLDAHTWHGNGHLVFNESIYLIEGERSALLIDAGTRMPGLRKIVEGIVKKPVTLIISHAHGDHTGAINEWDSLWINAADMAIVPKDAYKGVVRYLSDGQVFDLGGRQIEVVFTPGHTPGSTTFIDKEAHYGFSSDAFGSGNLLVFTDLSTQWASCLRFSRFMETYGIKYLYPGHYWGDNLETPQRVKDVATICDGVLTGTIVPENSKDASLPYIVDKYGVKVNFSDKQIRGEVQTPQRQWGIQLYTLRTMIGSPELYKTNHDRVFSTLSGMGFTQAELYGYEDGKIFGIPAAQFVADVRQAGITPVSSHVQYALTDKEIKTGDFSGKLQWWKDCIAMHKKIGVSNIVYVWYALPKTMLELQRIAEYLNWIGEMCREEGVSFGYHNHDHELKKVENKEVMLDYLLTHTNSQNVFIEMDVYWTVYGNGSPVDYFTRYPGRFKILHIKDQYEIGQSGMVGFDAIFNNLKLSGAEYLIVEQETSIKKDMLESLAISMNYLKGRLTVTDGECNETMFQVATLQSLMLGNYDGYLPVSQLRKHGDMGVGTFERIDGEMIMLDGTVYQARSDGSVIIADDNTGVPFATVTGFDCDTVVTVNKIENLKSLTARLNDAIAKHGRNLIYAVRIDVPECEKIIVRSEVAQDKPYRMLAETMATAQREFSYHNLGGTVVAVYFPEFYTSQNTPGWHFHFVSDDRTKGGHVLDMRVGSSVMAQIDITPNFNLFMPEDESFSHRMLDADMSKDIQKVEK